jgi:4-hydroxybenzoate polyprenyltransferase
MATTLRIATLLTRFDASALVFLVVFAPLFAFYGDAWSAARPALPLLAICMCGFVLNNIRDVERDRENHPDRPLPRGEVTEAVAAAVFLVLLVVALALLKILIPAQRLFPYVLVLLALITYNYIVDYFPYLKNLAVALAGLLPIAIIASENHNPFPVEATMLAALFFLISIEMLRDILDASGDGMTLVKKLGLSTGANLSFGFKFLSDFTLLLFSTTTPRGILSLGILVTDVALVFLWIKAGYRRSVIRAMKAELALSIFYLI